jgi:riboflavin biosynthesis pyrimidine reductase/polyhydroxyalkanoate synthesis regulator phasin
VRELHPPLVGTPAIEVAEAYAGLTLPTGAARAVRGDEDARRGPWLALGMVSSVDGGAALGGVTAALGGAADRVAFGRLRAAADLVLVGAGTVRAERYGPPTGTEERRADRVARGLAPVPRLAIVTGAVSLGADHRVFSDPANPPVVITTNSAPADRIAALAPVAEVVQVGWETVDLAAAMAELGSRGYERVLCEGGPRLNDTLLAADLVDEIFLTLTPTLLGGRATRIVQGEQDPRAHALSLVGVVEHEGELLLRYRRDRDGGAGRTLRGEPDARSYAERTRAPRSYQMNPSMQRYSDAASGLTNLTTAKAEQIVKQLVRSGEAAGDQVGDLVEDLLERSRSNRDSLAALVRAETTRAVKAMGLAPAKDVERLQKQVADLKRELVTIDRESGSGRSPAATAKKTTGKKATAKKAAKKSTAKKSTAKKSTAKKSTAKKSTAKKSTAKKSTAKKSTAKKSTAKKATKKSTASSS